MAFALKGAGSNTSAFSLVLNQTSLVVGTVTTAGAAGDLAVLLYAVDNNQTTDGDEGAVTSVTDSAGNFWQKAVEFTNGQAAAQAGATCGIWFCNLQNAMSVGTFITINFNNAASRDVSALSLTYFTKAAGFKAAVEGTPGTLANDAAAAGSLSVTTANIACLRVRAIASESNTATALTPTATFAAVTQAVCTNATSASNQAIRGEWVINTGTGTASAPTGGAGAVDNASVYVAFKEVAIDVGDPPHDTDYQGAQVATNTRKAIAATLIAASAGLFMPPAPPPSAPQGWQQPLSTAPKVARAAYLQPGLVAAPASAAAAALGGWQGPLSIAPKLTPAAYFQPQLVIAPASAAVATIGIPLHAGGAPPRVNNVYYQARVEPYFPVVVAAAVSPYGWQAPLSTAKPVARAIDTNQPFPFAPSAAASLAWQGGLSTSPAPGKAQAGFSFVPYDTAQLSASFTVFGWHQALVGAPPVAKPQPGYTSVPYDTAQLVVSFTSLGWQQPLSVAAAVARAKPSEAFVPFDTAQPVVVYPTGIPLDMGGAPPRTNRVYYQSKVETPYIAPEPNTVTIDKWQQPFSVASPVAKPQPGFSFVPLNTAQLVAGVYTAWYLQPLSIAAPVNTAQPGYSFVPLDTRQVVSSTTLEWQPPLSTPVKLVAASPTQPTFTVPAIEVPRGWYQALSIPPLAAKVQLGSVTPPTYVAPVVLAGIAGMAWFTPLAVPLKMQNRARQTELISITRYDTVAPVGTLPHSKPFFATPGKLMNI